MHWRRRFLVIAVAVSCLALGSATAVAAGDGYTICGRTYDTNNTFAWERVRPRYQERIDARAYKSVVTSLRGELLASTAQRDRDLTARFDGVAARLEQVFPVQCSDFGVFKDEGGRELARTTYWIFPGYRERAILLNEDCADEVRVIQIQELRHLSESFQELCALALQDSMDMSLERIKAIEAKYDRYLFEGYPMFPWEALVNSWVLAPKHLAEGPPRDQIVLFHPIAGVVASTTTFAEAVPDLALGIDLVGWVHYPNRADYRSWWGLTAMAAVANDHGVGLGLALQWDNFRLAAVYHDDDRDGQLFDDRPSVFLGVDLYHFVKEKYRTYEPYLDKVRELKGAVP